MMKPRASGMALIRDVIGILARMKWIVLVAGILVSIAPLIASAGRLRDGLPKAVEQD